MIQDLIDKWENPLRVQRIYSNEGSEPMNYREIKNNNEINTYILQRMVLCRKAADKLGLQFKLVINGQPLI